MSVKRRLPTRKEIGLLRQLNARIGVTRLAQALDIPFYTCRSLLAIDRMTERTLTQVRDRLPQVVGQYLDGPAPVRRKKVVRPPSEPLQPIDPDVRAQLNALQPYVSMVRLSQVLGFSTKTLRAVAAGYRPLRGSTQQLLRDQLAELLRPPRHLLREALLTPSAAVLQSLQNGFLAPLPGFTTAETEAFVTARPRVAQAG